MRFSVLFSFSLLASFGLCLFLYLLENTSESGFFDPNKRGRFFHELIRGQQWQQLINEINSIRQKRPLNPHEKQVLSQVLLELGQPHEALIVIEDAFGTGLNKGKAYFLKAKALLNLGEFKKAEQWARHWLLKEAKNPEASYYLALSLILRPDDFVDVDRYREGLSFLHKAIRGGTIEKESARQLLSDTYMFLGVHFRDQGKIQEALNYMRIATKLEPEKGSFHHTLGKIYISLKRWVEALDSLDRAFSLGVEGTHQTTNLLDDLCTTYHQLAVISLLENRYLDAIEQASEGLNWATTQVMEGRLRQVFSLAQQKYIQSLYQQVREASSQDQARQIWEQLLRLDPQNPEARWEVAQYLEEAERLRAEQDVLASHWGAEARKRLADRAFQKGQNAQGIDFLVEAWLISEGKSRLDIEERIFLYLQQSDYRPNQKPWNKVADLLQADIYSEKWVSQQEKVEKYLKERYYMWIYFVDIFLKRGEIGKANQLFLEIKSLDPPKHVGKYLENLSQRLSVPEEN